jgi:hypothetical protein
VGERGAPTTWRRIYDEGVAVGLDPRLGAEIGRLALADRLTETQATAGVFVGNWYAQAAKAILPPRRSPASPSLMRYSLTYTTDCPDLLTYTTDCHRTGCRQGLPCLKAGLQF